MITYRPSLTHPARTGVRHGGAVRRQLLGRAIGLGFWVAVIGALWLAVQIV